MTRNFVRILAAAMALFGAAATGWAQAPTTAVEAASALAPQLRALRPGDGAAGLLLGVRSGDAYRTVYLTYDGQTAAAQPVADLLASPQRDGWWRFGAGHYRPREFCADGACTYDRAYLWGSRGDEPPPGIKGEVAMPADEIATMLDFARDLGVGLYHDEQATFTVVANGVACYEFQLEGYLGGAHPYADWGARCVRLGEGLVSAQPEVDFREFFDAATAARIEAELWRKYQAREFDIDLAGVDLGALEPPDMERLTLTMRRQGGRVMAATFATTPSYYALTPRYALYMNVDIGPAFGALAPYNDMPLDYAALADAAPGLVDAFVAPTHNVVWLLFRDRVVGVAAPSGRVVEDYPLAAEAAVIAEWALGRNVARWARDLADLGG